MTSVDLITRNAVSAHDIKDGIDVLGLGTPVEASFHVKQIVARILNVSAVTDAVYPYPEVFRHVLTDVSLIDKVFFDCAPHVMVY